MAKKDNIPAHMGGTAGTTSGSYSDPTFSKSFQDRADAINAAYSGSQLKKTGMDYLANFFGARSSYDKQIAQLEQSRREALLQLKTNEAEQEYNSESATAQRMRAAGLNPDLQGLGEGSEASEFNEPEAATDFSGLTTGQDLFRNFASAFTTAISVFSGVQSLAKQGIEIANSEIESAITGHDSALDFLKSVLNTEQFKDFFDQNKGVDSDLLTNYLTNKHVYHSLGIRSPRAARQLSTSIINSIGNLKGQLYKYKSSEELVDAIDSLAKKGNEWYREDGVDSTYEQVAAALKPWQKFVHDCTDAQLRFSKKYFLARSPEDLANAETAQAKYQIDYFSDLDGKTRSGYENAAAEYNRYVMQQKETLIRRLTGPNASTFSLILATQLMGEVDFLGNSGAGELAKGVGKLVF